jgi:proteasome assembly chaperone (PAC2) family protein
MNPHVRFDTNPKLDRPALVCAFQGWNDGGEAASSAARYLMERWEAVSFGRIDAEEFYDFQVNRPVVRLENGVSRVIDWPHPTFAAASPAGRDVVFLTAPEPSVRWRSFTQAVLDAGSALGADMLVTLGGFLTDVPHGRDVPVVGSARDEAEAQRLGLSHSRYEGPTGILGVLHEAANRAGLTSISLWAAVPHYLPVAPNPKAALALVQRLTAILHTEVELASLQQAAREWEDSVGRLLEENSELGAYVEQLEQAVDSGDTEIRITEDIPSGDAIAAELERFLRENETGDETD